MLNKLPSLHLLVFLFGLLLLFLQDTSLAFSSSGAGGRSSSSRKVNVCETRKIPGVSVTQAYQGFLDFTWKKGGGLPVLLILDKDNPSKRNLFLLGEEVLLNNTSSTATTTHNDDDDKENNNYNNNNNKIVQEYKLTKLGPIWKSEIEQGSHTGVVSFTSFEADEEEESNNNNDGSCRRHSSSSVGTEITWNVSFQTLNRKSLWQSVTESSISDACDNLICYLSEPLLMTKRVSIRRRQLNHKILANEWMEFIWRKGGGLPLPLPPIQLRSDWNDRIIIPPFLIERIVEINETSDYTDIIYTVVNPSIITYPVFTHLGRVRFQSSLSSSSGRHHHRDDSTNDGVMRKKEEDEEEAIDMIWQVNIRPLNNSILKKFAMVFTESIVSILARNFKRHIEDMGDDRTVKVYPPRGFMKENGELFQVRKDTWLGSVLYAHYRDNRSLADQTKDIFMPWRWGKMDEIDGTLSWGLGDLPDED
ncbi:MAG: hypothetical protein ACI90V_001009 [Bacillariaceae sp.]|jgi:hypothetical protein